VPDDESIPICGVFKAGYTCYRKPEHTNSGVTLERLHASLTSTGMMVFWVEGEIGVKIRKPTFTERELMQAAMEANDG